MRLLLVSVCVIGLVGCGGKPANTTFISSSAPAGPVITTRAAPTQTASAEKADPVASLVKKLESSDPAVQAEAAKALGGLGTDGAPAARALCQAALSKNEKVKEAALDAIERVWPEGGKHVSQIVLGMVLPAQASVEALGKLGPKAAAATPVLQDYLMRAKDHYLSPKGSGQGGVVRLAVQNLAWVSFDDPDSLKLAAALIGPKNLVDKDILEGAVGAVSFIGQKNAALRKEATRTLIPVLSMEPPPGLSKFWAVQALGKFGPDAKEAVPALEKLKLDVTYRKAASDALEQIQK